MYRGTSLIRNTHFPRIPIGPETKGYCKVLRGAGRVACEVPQYAPRGAHLLMREKTRVHHSGSDQTLRGLDQYQHSRCDTPPRGRCESYMKQSFFSCSLSITFEPRLSDTHVHSPRIRARLGTTAHVCQEVVLTWSVRVPAALERVIVQGRLAQNKQNPPSDHQRTYCRVPGGDCFL